MQELIEHVTMKFPPLALGGKILPQGETLNSAGLQAQGALSAFNN